MNIMEDKPFLEDQYSQLSKIFESYKNDIDALNDIVESWEESNVANIEKLSESIKHGIKNQTKLEIRQDNSENYLLEMEFHPITIAWILATSNQKL